MPGRKFTSSAAYRYGFSGHEKVDEISGDANQVDMGGRYLDTRLGRTLSLDPEASAFPGISSYIYALDNPLNVIDPDGHLIIFVNGQHSGVSDEGGRSSYWAGVDNKIMNRIGDTKAMYRDGSSGGFVNTILSTLFSQSSNNLSLQIRMLSGMKQGKIDAAHIIAGLKRDPNDPNKIVESIKIISHSMGTAYSRGYAKALKNYIADYNKKNKDAPLTGFNIETTVDIAGFQGSQLPADPAVPNKFYMSGDADGVANGKGSLKAISPSSDIPGAVKIPTDAGTEHGIEGFGKDKYIDQIPKSTQNAGQDCNCTPKE